MTDSSENTARDSFFFKPKGKSQVRCPNFWGNGGFPCLRRRHESKSSNDMQAVAVDTFFAAHHMLSAPRCVRFSIAFCLWFFLQPIRVHRHACLFLRFLSPATTVERLSFPYTRSQNPDPRQSSGHSRRHLP